MVDTVTSKTLFSGRNRLIMEFTNISDGTGETNVVKVDRSTLTGPGSPSVTFPPTKVRIDYIQFSVNGFEGVKVSWDDTQTGPVDETVAILVGDGYWDYKMVGGNNPTLPASDLTSAVGDVLFTTNNAAPNDTYTITLGMTLGN